MAAVSAPQAPSALTPPTSSHGGSSSWNFSVPSQAENLPSRINEKGKAPISQSNGNVPGRKLSQPDIQNRGDNSGNTGYLAPVRVNALSRQASNISETGSAPDSLLDLYGPNKSGMNSVDYGERKGAGKESYNEDDTEHSRWIHRDKLARIESQELQAAGIILPRTRAASKSSRREHSRDQQSNGHRSEQGGQKRQRIDEVPSPDQEVDIIESWDLRTPEEAAEDPRFTNYMDVSGGVKGVSRIPVLKTSPLPIPIEHLERDTILPRKNGHGLSPEDDLSIPKTRERSRSINIIEDAAATPTPSPSKRATPGSSPTKKNPPARKVPSSRVASAPQKVKPKPTQTRDTNSGQRPSTRSGELSSMKRPEGDPPWLSSMYKPDPRLPPDQQLLPTVAKRLQQEQWEKEGKFGNAYDTSFRPLNDEQLPQPNFSTQSIEVDAHKSEQLSPEWPLQPPKSPALSTGRSGTANKHESYSTMPKLTTSHTGTPQGVGPLPSPKPPTQRESPPEDAKEKGGCGCCAVM